MFQYLLYIGAFIWAAWKIKGAIFLAILLLFIGGCLPTGTTEVVYVVEVEEEKPAEDTIIFIDNLNDGQPYHHWVFRATPYCGNAAKALSPYSWQPDTCYMFADGNYECDWMVDTGYRGPLCYETYLWDDDDCQWYYLFDWCGGY